MKNSSILLIILLFQAISGNCGESSEIQQSQELGILPKKKRELVCAKAGIRNRTFVSRRVSLAIKSHVQLTWNQMRKQKRYFRSVGVEFESEKSEREEQRSVLGDHLVGELIKMEEKNENAPESTSGIVLRDTPTAFVKNLPKFVTDLLDRYQSCDQLVWSQDRKSVV